jgi:hypothetical protein
MRFTMKCNIFVSDREKKSRRSIKPLLLIRDFKDTNVVIC